MLQSIGLQRVRHNWPTELNTDYWFLHAAAKSLQPCPTVWPHKRQPTRLPHPWDSPGKNTGVGCHFLLQCMNVKSLSCVWLLVTPMDCSPSGSSIHGIFQARVLHSKGHIQQSHSKYHSQYWKTECISSQISNKTRITLGTVIQHSLCICN